MRVTFVLIALFLSLISSNRVLAGISTNGGTLTADQDNVWFVGTTPVAYCIDLNPNFPYSLQVVRELIRQSIVDWRSFFTKYELDRMQFDGINSSELPVVNTNLVEVADCDKPDEQIVFKFGGTNPQLESALVQGDWSLALSVRGDYNHSTYRNGGTVWVREYMYTQSQLKHMILHELGHVFGMGHDSVHVMNRQVADMIVRRGSAYDEYYGHIESPTWPYRLNSGDIVDFTFIGRNVGYTEPNFLLPFVRDVIGFELDKSHKLRLAANLSSSVGNAWKLDLEFTESATGKQAVFSGYFAWVEQIPNYVTGYRGPALYTTYHCGSCGQNGRAWKRFLDGRASGMNAHGYFVYNGVQFPAVLEHRKGLFLQMFVTGKNGWWSNINYLGSQALQGQ